MVGILLIRKIILWFFIIISPVFPILLLFYPVRNTGKIWIGEFFRWLLYGPLFAIFLQGLVFMWRWKGSGSITGGGGGGIPLQFLNPGIQDPAQIIYPTAVNILLGGPQQFVTLTNSINLTETFMLYVIALIMLWIVILLPWILLQIFLDYASNFTGDNAAMKAFVNLVGNKTVPPPSPADYTPAAPQPGGITLNLPFTKRTINIPISPMPAGQAREIIREQQEIGGSQKLTIPLAQISAEVMSFANIPLPTMRDVARYETEMLSNNANQRQEVYRMQQVLEKIANPVLATSTIERERYVNMKERLEKESQQGNIIATSILNAVNSASNNRSRRNVNIASSELRNILQQVANPALASNVVDRGRMSRLHEMLTRESKENNSQLASSILSVTSQSNASEIEKIREKLTEAQQQGNIMNATTASAITNALSNAASQSQSMTHIRTVLQQIAKPETVSNLVERERFSKLHDMLSKDSRENNNQLATSILSVSDKTTAIELDRIRDQLVKEQALGNSVASTIANTIKTTQIKNTLQHIANPASVTNTTEREKYSKLHDMLARESKEKNNELASSILQVKDTTTLSELEKITDKLQQSKDSTISSQVLSTINNSIQQSQSSTKVKNVLQQIANPAITSTIDRQKLSRLHDALTKESQKGNELASSILAVNEKTSTSDIQKLQEKLRESKEKGQSIATDVLEITSQQVAINIPSSNRIQNVTSEELLEVKQMWKENYQGMEVPEGMAGTRTEWIKDDIEKISNLTGLLTSQDQEKVNQGLSEVANILPFLLVGGFSQSEIVSYLTTKQEAAKEVLESITREEET
ncbi:hypothetical protein KJ980_02600, partial [Patescibacteria group bacterium]|nr:hypothetical protein [Patescibacteria group bacterium]